MKESTPGDLGRARADTVDMAEFREREDAYFSILAQWWVQAVVCAQSYINILTIAAIFDADKGMRRPRLSPNPHDFPQQKTESVAKLQPANRKPYRRRPTRKVTECTLSEFKCCTKRQIRSCNTVAASRLLTEAYIS